MYTTIRLLMLKNKISFGDIAKALGISRNNASDKINGKANMTIDELKTIQKTFFANCSIDELAMQEG